MAKLYFIYAAMNAGKSAILLQASHNYHERGMKTLLMKPALDTRDGATSQITSRLGLAAEAETFQTKTDLQNQILMRYKKENFACILIDEAQFLTEEQVWQLATICDDHNIPVMCYGLRTDFLGNLFPGSAALLAIADSVRELRTICWCGKKATMVLRIDQDGAPVMEGAQVEVGGNDRYVSLCRKHWKAGQIKG